VPTTGYSYDPLSRVASITYPDGRVVGLHPNSLGQVPASSPTQGGGLPSRSPARSVTAPDGLSTASPTAMGWRESRLYTLAGRLETWTVGSEPGG